MGGSLLLHTRKEEIERVRGMRMYCRKMICYLAFLAFSLLTLSCMCQVVMAQIYGTCQPGYAISSGTLKIVGLIFLLHACFAPGLIHALGALNASKGVEVQHVVNVISDGFLMMAVAHAKNAPNLT